MYIYLKIYIGFHTSAVSGIHWRPQTVSPLDKEITIHHFSSETAGDSIIVSET